MILFTVGGSLAEAATITWGSATTISGDANVVTTGTLVGAYSIGNTGVPAATVNGVTFAALAAPDGATTVTAGNFTLNFSGSVPTNTDAGTTTGAFSTLSPAYQALLRSGTFSEGNSITLTVSGLTLGQAYTFQWWSSNSGNFTGVSQTVRATSGNSVLLDNNVTNSNGGRGQYAVGTFTANAATQTITFTSPDDFAYLTAFQLRQAVPEASSLVFGIVSFCLAAGRRRREIG